MRGLHFANLCFVPHTIGINKNDDSCYNCNLTVSVSVHLSRNIQNTNAGPANDNDMLLMLDYTKVKRDLQHGVGVVVGVGIDVAVVVLTLAVAMAIVLWFVNPYLSFVLYALCTALKVDTKPKDDVDTADAPQNNHNGDDETLDNDDS